jgi:plasmid segregation protein ParM
MSYPMTDTESINPIPVGIDDGYAYTKIALPDGRVHAIPSRARLGQSGVTWIHQAQQRVFEYETEGSIYSVGDVDGAPTQFEGYPVSGLNRVIVQHALQAVGLSGRTVHAVSGLPVNAFYQKNGKQRSEPIKKKQDSLKHTVRPLADVLSAGISFHEVIPEALAAWYDYVIVEEGDRTTLDADRLSVPVAIVDIGGRTTDYVVVKDQGIFHASSGSLQCGMLDVKQRVADGIQERFDLETLGEQIVAQAVESRVVRLQGRDHDISALVEVAKREVVERIHTETRRQLGLGVDLDRVLFVGGGAVALREHIANWFPHQAITEHPAFANARGMLKYLRYVCEASNAA